MQREMPVDLSIQIARQQQVAPGLSRFQWTMTLLFMVSSKSKCNTISTICWDWQCIYAHCSKHYLMDLGIPKDGAVICWECSRARPAQAYLILVDNDTALRGILRYSESKCNTTSNIRWDRQCIYAHRSKHYPTDLGTAGERAVIQWDGARENSKSSLKISALYVHRSNCWTGTPFSTLAPSTSRQFDYATTAFSEKKNGNNVSLLANIPVVASVRCNSCMLSS
jgi:hypothetical protein